MNKIKFLILPLLFSVVLFSCNNSKYADEGEPAPVVPVDPEPEELPVPLEPTAPFQYLSVIDLSLNADYSVTNNNMQTIVNVKHTIADVQTLIYTVHRKVDGAVVNVQTFGQERIRTEIKNGVFSIGRYLLEGGYYVSVVAMMNTGSYTFMQGLYQNYQDAVVQIFNAYAYYATMEIEVKSDKSASNRNTMQLKKITTDLVFEFPMPNKLPKDRYTLTVGVENIPSAFYLATGATLTDQEVKNRQLYRYSEDRIFQLPQEDKDTKKPLITLFHTLANDKLTNDKSERGRYWYKFEEKKEDEKFLLESDSKTIDECTPSTLFHLYTKELTLSE